MLIQIILIVWLSETVKVIVKLVLIKFEDFIYQADYDPFIIRVHVLVSTTAHSSIPILTKRSMIHIDSNIVLDYCIMLGVISRHHLVTHGGTVRGPTEHGSCIASSITSILGTEELGFVEVLTRLRVFFLTAFRTESTFV